MPPMFTAEDASDVSDGADDVIPPKKTASAKKKVVDEEIEDAADDEVAELDDDEEATAGGHDGQEAEDENAEDDDEDDDDDGAAEEYVVEKILKHDFNEDGLPLYHIKWQGYNKAEDRTWEPEANLSGAADILKAYHKKIGGRPQVETPASKTKGRAKRKSEAVESTPDVQTSARRRKRTKTNGDAKPSAAAEKKPMPEGSWEDIVQSIESIEQEEEQPAKSTKSAKPSRILNVLFITNDGRKYKHSHVLVKSKCPQKLLDYYEQRLKFVTNTD